MSEGSPLQKRTISGMSWVTSPSIFSSEIEGQSGQSPYMHRGADAMINWTTGTAQSPFGQDGLSAMDMGSPYVQFSPSLSFYLESPAIFSPSIFSPSKSQFHVTSRLLKKRELNTSMSSLQNRDTSHCSSSAANDLPAFRIPTLHFNDVLPQENKLDNLTQSSSSSSANFPSFSASSSTSYQHSSEMRNKDIVIPPTILSTDGKSPKKVNESMDKKKNSTNKKSSLVSSNESKSELHPSSSSSRSTSLSSMMPQVHALGIADTSNKKENDIDEDDIDVDSDSSSIKRDLKSISKNIYPYPQFDVKEIKEIKSNKISGSKIPKTSVKKSAQDKSGQFNFMSPAGGMKNGEVQGEYIGKSNDGGEGTEGTPTVVTCKCKKSKCLKLYCDCFALLKFCNPECGCNDCHNDSNHEEIRKTAIIATMQRTVTAFTSKVTPTSTHVAGCHCSKSNCLKKYCECFLAGATCGLKCKCMLCKNFTGSAALNAVKETAETSSSQKTIQKSVKKNKLIPSPMVGIKSIAFSADKNNRDILNSSVEYDSIGDKVNNGDNSSSSSSNNGIIDNGHSSSSNGHNNNNNNSNYDNNNKNDKTKRKYDETFENSQNSDLSENSKNLTENLNELLQSPQKESNKKTTTYDLELANSLLQISSPMKRKKVNEINVVYPFFGKSLPMIPKICALRCLEFLDDKDLYSASVLNSLWSKTAMDNALWE